MQIKNKAVLPAGFQANAVACGIKKSAKPDLALFYAAYPAKASCLFTSNKILAAPLQVNQRNLQKNKVYRAILVNSGNANAFTGSAGVKDAEETSRILARALNLKKENILLASTGIIGRKPPVIKIKKAIPGLVKGLSPQGIEKAKKAILTTDTFTKEITLKFKIGRKAVRLCGIAKGAGMIAPHLATMLCFLFTDAKITQGALDKALRRAVKDSFNAITVDGCMSTNDSIMLLANGQAENNLIRPNKNFSTFAKALNIACRELAKMIVRDAEGATKFISIKVNQARNSGEARKIAQSIANSNLFKTAVFGQNPNFGRIVAAIGASGVKVKEKNLKIRVSPLEKKEIEVSVSIKQGKASYTVYTADLTPEYVRINAGYN